MESDDRARYIAVGLSVATMVAILAGTGWYFSRGHSRPQATYDITPGVPHAGTAVSAAGTVSVENAAAPTSAAPKSRPTAKRQSLMGFLAGERPEDAELHAIELLLRFSGCSDVATPYPIHTCKYLGANNNEIVSLQFVGNELTGIDYRFGGQLYGRVLRELTASYGPPNATNGGMNSWGKWEQGFVLNMALTEDRRQGWAYLHVPNDTERQQMSQTQSADKSGAARSTNGVVIECKTTAALKTGGHEDVYLEGVKLPDGTLDVGLVAAESKTVFFKNVFVPEQFPGGVLWVARLPHSNNAKPLAVLTLPEQGRRDWWMKINARPASGLGDDVYFEGTCF